MEEGKYKKTQMIGTIVNANILSSTYWVAMAGITGSTFIAKCLMVYDTTFNTMAIGLLFKPRVSEVLGQYANYAMPISLGIALCVSIILCFSIILTSIKAKKDTEGVTDEFKAKMERWSEWLIFVSGFISLIGFIIFITPPNATINDVWTLQYVLMLIFGGVLSFIPSFLSKVFSEDISYYISQRFNNVIESIDKETVSAIEESAEEELRNENTVNLSLGNNSPFKITKRTGTNG